MHVSLGGIIAKGIALAPHEAVAVIQRLIEDRLHAAPLRSPSASPLTIDDIDLGSDGAVRCRRPDASPSIAETAGLLDLLLPVRSGAVPDELRLIVARAIHGKGPDSLADFSAALRSSERGPRSAIIRQLLNAVDATRLQSSPRPETVPLRPPPGIERRPDGIEFVEMDGGSALDAFLPETAAPESRVVVPMPPRRPPPADKQPPRLPPRLADQPAEPKASTPPPQPELHLRETGAVSAPGNVDSTQPSPRLGWKSAATVAAIAALIGIGSFLLFLRQSATNEPDAATANSIPADTNDDVPAGGSITPPLGAGGPPSLPGFSPAFASHGSVVFFHTGGSGAPRSDIAMAELDRDQPRIVRIIGDGSRNYHAQPSPDGRLLAFDSDREGERAVYVANRDGSNVKRISGRGYAAVPTWAPDGKRIAFVRAEEGRPAVWNLWLLTIDSGAPRRITRYRSGQTWGASWFPGGDRIVYTHETRIIVRDLVSGATREFDSPLANHLVRTAAVSRDGTRVMFQVHRDGVWILNLGDGSMQRVLADPTAEEFAWAPDGTRVAFHSRYGNNWGIQVAAFSP